MSTKRNQVTTYVDVDTLKWIKAGALKQRRTVSQFLAGVIMDAARPATAAPVPQPRQDQRAESMWPAPPVPAEPSKPKELSPGLKEMRERALCDGGHGSVENHKAYLGKALRTCVITRPEHDAKVLWLDALDSYDEPVILDS